MQRRIHLALPRLSARLLSHSNSESFSGAVDDNSPSDKQKRPNGQFRVMNLARGYTAEADKLLDYLVCLLLISAFFSVL
jgi:hypothetical protein